MSQTARLRDFGAPHEHSSPRENARQVEQPRTGLCGWQGAFMRRFYALPVDPYSRRVACFHVDK